MSPSAPNPHIYPFPHHSGPRTWLLTAGASPLALALARAVLAHGDSVVLCVDPVDLQQEGSHQGDEVGGGGQMERATELERFMEEDVMGLGEGRKGGNGGKDGWRSRCKVLGLSERVMGQCQAAVAEAVATFGKIDILFCCTSEAVVGTVEELAASRRTLSLIREQFETNFFGPVNIIKASLPAMREKRNGHVIIWTGITSHLGTPGLGIYCASGWALEGYCDSLAYEIAPFNIKMTIVQSNIEINVLTNKITSAPLLPQYSPDAHPAPLARTIIGGLIDRIEGNMVNDDEGEEEDDGTPERSHQPHWLSSDQIETLYPKLPPEMKSSLIAETTHALTAIGGHENPPARHIVGFEGVASVKEKLKTVSEELEDFVEVSSAVDIETDGHGGASARESKVNGG